MTSPVRIATPPRRPYARLTALVIVATLCLSIVAGTSLAPSSVSAATSRQVSPEEMIASLDGVETAYARRYVSSDHTHAFVDATPTASPSAASNDMTFAEVTILQFATEADAIQAWKLTSGTLIAGAIIGKDPADLTATKVDGLGDDATMYLMPDATGSETEADGMLFARSGIMGIVISGRGETSNAALGDRMQDFATFIIDQPAPSAPVEVTHEGVATGGDFDRMPGPGDSEVLQGLTPMYDYDLTVSNSPILPPNATPDDCACSQQDFPPSTPTPMPSCSCTPPKQG